MPVKSNVVPTHEIVRSIVLDNYNGAAGIGHILADRRLREGYDQSDIYQCVSTLRKKLKGVEGKDGIEAWEILDNVVIGLERLLDKDMRRRINKRHRSAERGIAGASILDNRIFQGKLKKSKGIGHINEINKALDVSTDSLEDVSDSAKKVSQILDDYSSDFEERNAD